MKLLLLALYLLIFPTVLVTEQQFNSAVKNVFIVTRMGEKFHLQPRQLNDEFSLNLGDKCAGTNGLGFL